MGCGSSKQGDSKPPAPKSPRSPQPSSPGRQVPRKRAMVCVPDTHVSLVPYFSVTEAKLVPFKALFPRFVANTASGSMRTDEGLYYSLSVAQGRALAQYKDPLGLGGMATGKTVFARAGFRSIAGVEAHLQEVFEEIREGLEIIGGQGKLNMALVGPKEELDKVRLQERHLIWGTQFFELVPGGFFQPHAPQAGADQQTSEDTHVSLNAYFTVPQGRITEMTSLIGQFYERTRAGTLEDGECLYYSFAADNAGSGPAGTVVLCRAGFKTSGAFRRHLSEVQDLWDQAEAIAGKGFALALVGPAAALDKDKVRSEAKQMGARLFEVVPDCGRMKWAISKAHDGWFSRTWLEGEAAVSPKPAPAASPRAASPRASADDNWFSRTWLEGDKALSPSKPLSPAVPQLPATPATQAAALEVPLEDQL